MGALCSISIYSYSGTGTDGMVLFLRETDRKMEDSDIIYEAMGCNAM